MQIDVSTWNKDLIFNLQTSLTFGIFEKPSWFEPRVISLFSILLHTRPRKFNTFTPLHKFVLPPVLHTFHRAVTRASLSGDHFLYSRDRSLEGCPIHPNRCESSKAVDKSSNRKWIRGLVVLWYRSSEKPSLMTWKRILEVSLQEKRIYSESVCDRGLKMLSNRHESTPIERLVTTNDDPSYRMSICKTRRKYSASVYGWGLQMFPNRNDSTPIERLVTKKWRPVIPDVDLQDTANRHPVWRIVICCDESFDSSPTVSNHQHLLRCIVYNILTIDFRSFHALKTWKVHVVMFLYHATHFHLLLTCTCAPLDFRYVNARFDF